MFAHIWMHRCGHHLQCKSWRAADRLVHYRAAVLSRGSGGRSGSADDYGGRTGVGAAPAIVHKKVVGMLILLQPVICVSFARVRSQGGVKKAV